MLDMIASFTGLQGLQFVRFFKLTALDFVWDLSTRCRHYQQMFYVTCVVDCVILIILTLGNGNQRFLWRTLLFCGIQV